MNPDGTQMWICEDRVFVDGVLRYGQGDVIPMGEAIALGLVEKVTNIQSLPPESKEGLSEAEEGVAEPAGAADPDLDAEPLPEPPRALPRKRAGKRAQRLGEHRMAVETEDR